MQREMEAVAATMFHTNIHTYIHTYMDRAGGRLVAAVARVHVPYRCSHAGPSVPRAVPDPVRVQNDRDNPTHQVPCHLTRGKPCSHALACMHAYSPRIHLTCTYKKVHIYTFLTIVSRWCVCRRSPFLLCCSFLR
jgi:hypothetical protein